MMHADSKLRKLFINIISGSNGAGKKNQIIIHKKKVTAKAFLGVACSNL